MLLDTIMNLSLTPQLESFVRDRAESGEYNNASEVVRDALRLLKQTEEERALKLINLRNAIQQGDDALARGESSVFNTEEELDSFFAKL